MTLWPIVRGIGLAVGAGVFLVAAAPAEDAGKYKESRKSLIKRAKVRLPVDVAPLDLKSGPSGAGAFTPGATINCEYMDKQLGGMSPKFACRLPDGDEIKVKYGGANGEVYAEVATSRLLWALGFGADHMYSVRVVCRGCPENVGGILRANGERILDPAAVERKMPGRELSDHWSWPELDEVDESAGGATKAERDALKLVAVLLQHSDSKPEQQRIVCADASTKTGERCDMPIMMIGDLGVTWGRANTFNTQPGASVHLLQWAKIPVWKGARGCVGNLAGSATGTLKDPVIGEEGRQLLAALLLELSDQQLSDMFEAARVQLRPRAPDKGELGFPSIEEWVDAFKQKRTQIVERRCA